MFPNHRVRGTEKGQRLPENNRHGKRYNRRVITLVIFHHYYRVGFEYYYRPYCSRITVQLLSKKKCGTDGSHTGHEFAHIDKCSERGVCNRRVINKYASVSAHCASPTLRRLLRLHSNSVASCLSSPAPDASLVSVDRSRETWVKDS